MALFQKNDSSTKIANNIWNVIVKKWLNVKLLTCKGACIFDNIQDCEHSRVINWLIDCPHSVKRGNSVDRLCFYVSLARYKIKQIFFIFCTGGIWIFTICERFTQLCHARMNLTLRHAKIWHKDTYVLFTHIHKAGVNLYLTPALRCA